MSIDNQTQVESLLESLEKSEELIRTIKHRDDRKFVYECLSGVPGDDRITLVNQYLVQFQQGSEAEPGPIKSENAGRYRANTWLRERNEK